MKKLKDIRWIDIINFIQDIMPFLIILALTFMLALSMHHNNVLSEECNSYYMSLTPDEFSRLYEAYHKDDFINEGLYAYGYENG